MNQAETTQLRNNTTVCVWDFDPSGALRPAGAPWVAHDEIRVTVSSVYDFLHFLNLASRTMTGRSTMRLETNWTFTPPSNPYGVNHSGPIGPPDCPALP